MKPRNGFSGNRLRNKDLLHDLSFQWGEIIRLLGGREMVDLDLSHSHWRMALVWLRTRLQDVCGDSTE